MSNYSQKRYEERQRKSALLASLALASDSPPVRVLREGHLAAASLSGAPVGAPRGGAVQAEWVRWLSPVFGDNDSAYLTGTYSDDYGEPHGCMLARNVLKDFWRFLGEWDFGGACIVGVEPHKYRDILHLHAILQGPFTAEQLKVIQGFWAAERGHAKCLPVLDGCASYVTKYAMKRQVDAFDWRLA